MARPVLTHVALHVADFARSVAFYREFCGLVPVHERGAGGDAVAWLAEPGREKELIFVLVAGGPRRARAEGDFTHFGFALESRAAVDAVAARARAAGCLLWPPREEPYPVGYYCGVSDPDGHAVEFSYGQPLGPGASPSPSPPSA
jgi:catechol 2,3-dioxygenase-like lactoylglutathione lyase family enzyme